MRKKSFIRILTLALAVSMLSACFVPASVFAKGKGKKNLVKTVVVKYYDTEKKKWMFSNRHEYEYNKKNDPEVYLSGSGPQDLYKYKYKYKGKTRKASRRLVTYGYSKTMYKYNKSGVYNKEVYKRTGSYKSSTTSNFTLKGYYVVQYKSKYKYENESPYTSTSDKYKIKLKKGLPVSMERLDSEGNSTRKASFYTKGKKKGLLKAIERTNTEDKKFVTLSYKFKKGKVSMIETKTFYDGKLENRYRYYLTYDTKTTADDARYAAMIYSYSTYNVSMAPVHWY